MAVLSASPNTRLRIAFVTWLISLPLGCKTGGDVLTIATTSSALSDAGDSAGAKDGTSVAHQSTSRADDATPSDGHVEFGDVSAVVAGTDHTCLLQDERAYCVGANTSGQLGASGTDPTLTARAVTLGDVGDSSAVEQLVAGYGYTCLRLDDGRVSCFGLNERGQLGSGDHASRFEPQVVNLPGAVKTMSTKFGTVCVVLEANTDVTAGSVYCWGANDNNQCGTGTFEADDDEATPVAPILDIAARDVSVGRGHTCVLSDADELWCWGSNGSNELGLGPDAPGLTTSPSRVSDLLFAQVAAGQNHTCAITTDQHLYCWGDVLEADGHPGPMGHDDGETHDVPARVGADADWTFIATDTFHSCGLRGEGALWCWGRNAEGQLGVGSPDVVPSRVNVNPDERFMSVTVGRFHTCAVRNDGAVLCAGKNDNGELSSGDTERRATLTPMQ
jgi:alpha-tubulin suppressor-like RCC1 family protein